MIDHNICVRCREECGSVICHTCMGILGMTKCPSCKILQFADEICDICTREEE